MSILSQGKSPRERWILQRVVLDGDNLHFTIVVEISEVEGTPVTIRAFRLHEWAAIDLIQLEHMDILVLILENLCALHQGCCLCHRGDISLQRHAQVAAYSHG